MKPQPIVKMINKNLKKEIICIVMLIFLSSCLKTSDKYFKILQGEWQITKFYHNGENIAGEHNYLLGFEKNNRLWINKIDGRTDDFISADYTIFKEVDTLKIKIDNCEMKNLDGSYNLYIDTIQDFDKQHIIEITLDHENTYIKARKLKNKE